MLVSSRSHARGPVQRGLALSRVLLLALLVAALALPAAALAAPAATPAIVVTKTANPTAVLEPGALVTFTVTVENISGDFGTVTLTDLVDDVYGDLLNPANPLVNSNTCADNTVILYGDTYTCSFVGNVTGAAGSQHTNTVTGTAVNGGQQATDDDDAVVTVLDNDGAIGDYVWYDADEDGIEDVQEIGIGNVTVNLYLDDGDGVFEPGVDDVLLDTTLTGQDGGYIFTGLEPGKYWVEVVEATGVLAGLTPTGTLQESQASPLLVDLSLGEIYRDADFGYYATPDAGNAIIGDTVWYDYDGDGFQDAGEPGIPGVTVCATPSGGGAPICDVTDVNGNYLIQVPAGSYDVAPTDPPAGYTLTTPPSPLPVTVVAGQQFLDADFGYDSPAESDLGTIGGTLWQDLDNDGVLDAGEPLLAGVSVDLLSPGLDGQCGSADDAIVGTVTTDEQGDYLFTGLPYNPVDGTTYCVVVSDTQNRLDDYDPSTVFPVTQLDGENKAQPYPVTLDAANINDTTADFAYVKEPTGLGTIGNQVWVEYVQDGVWGAPGNGEWGVEGVTIELRGATGALIATTTTGPSGDYVFTSVPPGTYVVVLTDTFGVLAGYGPTLSWADDQVDNHNQNQLGTINVTVLPDGSVMWADFGFISGPNAVTVSGLAATSEPFPWVPLLVGIIIGATAALLWQRRRLA